MSKGPTSTSEPNQTSAVEVAPNSKQTTSTVYEDEVHLNAIRTALAGGNAAVLVGAGFSRNAEGGKNVGTWVDLAKALAAGMSPTGRQLEASVANATQLAEQYEQLFSRSHLEQVLKSVVPDEKLSPGALHHKLLSLPWSEVFTTNYDTLLERTAERLLDRSYFTVCCREDIPLSRVLGRKRIVKLHGSFSAHRPFILTEEDYRTYPQNFAPFVNLVRQALLENVLCLVGFSGDDPNFLSWIGWVRDMLDTHALPIYLFVTEQPPRGQTLLLKARGVIPVVLPNADTGEASDYAGRYRALLDQINPEKDESPDDWGSLHWPIDLLTYETDEKKIYESYCKSLPLVVEQRKRYPGWMVAPYEVRQRFRSALNSSGKSAQEREIQTFLKADAPAFSLAAIDIYCWAQSVVLDELNDGVGRLAVDVLRATAECQFSQLSPLLHERLKQIDCNAQSTIHGCWTRVLISVLAWARQTQHIALFEDLKVLAHQFRSKDDFVQDHVSYQSILLFLESGDKLSAQQALNDWSVQGNDVYMLIRWATLCAELGSTSVAISACERALQSLRQQQRMSPNDLQLLSEESWASLIAMRLLEARELEHSFGLTKSAEKLAPGSQTSRALDKRLDSAGKYSSRAELRRALEQLHREAGVPYVRNFKYNQFRLGTASSETVIGTPSLIRKKVEGAIAWFQLAERVGLFPRMPGVRFHDEDFLQAAWWVAYYFQQHDRALGTLLRCAQEDALKARDETRPVHETGWLSRSEVALLSSDRATALVQRLMQHIESLLLAAPSGLESRRGLGFYAEVLGRIVIRVENLDLVKRVALQALALYSSGPIARAPDTWKHLATVLAYCMEALDRDRQLDVLLELFKLPVTPPNRAIDYHADNWLPIRAFAPSLSKAHDPISPSSSDWQDVLNSLIELIIHTQDEHILSGAWERLFYADNLGLITPEQRNVLEFHLWGAWQPTQVLPAIPKFYEHAVFRWVGARAMQAYREYARQILAKKFTPFEGGGHSIIKGRSGRDWNLPVDLGQIAAISMLNDKKMPWSQSDFMALIRKVDTWLEEDGPILVKDFHRFNELREECQRVIAKVEIELFRAFVQLPENVVAPGGEVAIALQSLKENAALLGTTSLGLDILLSKLCGDSLALVAALGSLEMCLLTDDDLTLRNTYRLVSECLVSPGVLDTNSCQGVFNALVRVTFSGLAVPLAWALITLAELPEKVWQEHLSLQNLYLLDGALDQLFRRLAWTKGADRAGIPEDAVPLLRSNSARLAYALKERSAYLSPASEKWLNAAVDDPLPELRLGRFKH
jgi:SIR2-like domain